MRENSRQSGFRALGGLAQAVTSGLARKGAGGGRMASISRLRLDWAAIVGTPDSLTKTTAAAASNTSAACKTMAVATVASSGAALISRDKA